MQIQEFRQQNPAYDDMNDAELGFALWNSHYKDDMNAWDFAERFGLTADNVADMRKTALDSGLSEVDFAGDIAKKNVDKDVAKTTAIVHGQTLGLGDKVQGAMMAAEQMLKGSDKSWSELYDESQSYSREQLDEYRNQYPGEALTAEIGGAIASPVNALKLPGFLADLPRSIQATLRGFIEGTTYGANEAEENKLARGLETGVVSAFFTAGLDKLIKGFKPHTATTKSLISLRKNPTVENLKKAKTAAYKEVDKMGGIFGVGDIQKIWNAGDTAILDKIAYDPKIDKVVKSIGEQLQDYVKAGKVFTLSELDNVRRHMFRRMKNANENEQVIIRNMIGEIDNIIDSKPVEGAAMKLARSLHGRFMKTNQLDEAFNAARRSAEASGSGGNTYNLYKAAVKNILNNKNKVRYFSETEKAAMEHFITGDIGERGMRILSKASPSGNGLVFLITGIAATMNPALLGLSAAGYGAKQSLEKGIQRKAGQLIEDIGSGMSQASQRAANAPMSGIPALMSVSTGSPAGLDNPAEGLIDYMMAP